MRIAITKPLFAWDCLEDSPSLQTTGRFLEAVPDGKLLESLRRARGKGRNDYPVHVLWGVVLLTPLLRHSSFEACLGELRRNEALRRLHLQSLPRVFAVIALHHYCYRASAFSTRSGRLKRSKSASVNGRRWPVVLSTIHKHVSNTLRVLRLPSYTKACGVKVSHPPSLST